MRLMRNSISSARTVGSLTLRTYLSFLLPKVFLNLPPIARSFHTSDTHVLEVFDRLVNMERFPLTDIISIDEVHIDKNSHCKYGLVIQDFYSGEPIDLLKSRRAHVTEPYFASSGVWELHC